MTYLLDTHAFLWAAFMPDKLSPAASTAIRQSHNSIYLSSISLWEISLKYALGKIELTQCTPDDMPGIARQMHIEIVSPTAEETATFYRLPRGNHKDPFDRMIIWQAIQQNMTLITKDAQIPDYTHFGLKTLW